MPELKGARGGTWKDAEVEVSAKVAYRFIVVRWTFIGMISQWAAYAFADRAREKKRLEGQDEATKKEDEERKKEQKEKRMELKKKNSAWSSKVVGKEEKEKRREKKVKKRIWEKKQNNQTENPEDNGAEEWDELAREERSAKKARKGLVEEDDLDFDGL